ncbi:MAG: zinc-binding dehydrogenase [Rhodocyclaceae bacterium]|nr:zinc-binding dehydrogenase [Rhodocyclaceae bacterium]
MTTTATTGLQLRSLVTPNGELEISLQQFDIADPGADEVVIQVTATPINPSDLGLLFGMADLTTAKLSGTTERPIVTSAIPEAAMKAMQGRVGVSMPVGNEGAGVVVRAGSSPQAQALLGRTVAMVGGAMYTQFRTAKVAQCVPLPEGASAADGASIFVNPMTALSMTDAMRREGHSALVHTAAASNLGQMLNRICIKDGINLVNIVRNAEQEALLRDMGAKYICNSSAPDFVEDLTNKLAETGATIAFDAIGGGTLISQIFSCMEVAINRKAKAYSGYGSNTLKQVYVYGALDTGPTVLKRNFGFAFSLNGWLLTPYLAKIGVEAMQAMQARVLAELKTTFASHYSREISLAAALQPSEIAIYAQRTTGTKFLINPSLPA